MEVCNRQEAAFHGMACSNRNKKEAAHENAERPPRL
jgi:hypothetical protein